MLAALAIDRLTNFHSRLDFAIAFCKGMITVDIIKLNLNNDKNIISGNSNEGKNKLPLEVLV